VYRRHKISIDPHTHEAHIGIELLLFAIAVTPAWAEWKLLGSVDDGDVVIYVDAGMTRSNAGIRRMWSLQDLKKPGSEHEQSRATLYEYDCVERNVRAVSFRAYADRMGSGKVVRSSDDFTHDWTHVPSGTILDAQLRSACSQ
jgi:hypothetical protein